jgi:hypothetical protein
VLAAHVRQIPWAPGHGLGVLNTFLARLSADTLAALSWVRRATCGLTGHDMVRHFEPGRMSLECMHCGEQTPGWAVETRRI